MFMYINDSFETHSLSILIDRSDFFPVLVDNDNRINRILGPLSVYISVYQARLRKLYMARQCLAMYTSLQLA